MSQFADLSAAGGTCKSQPYNKHFWLTKEQRHALQILAAKCGKANDHKLLQQSAKYILQTLKLCQEATAAANLKACFDQVYTAGFRALNSILATLRSQHGLSTAELVELLRHFFTHGVELNFGLSTTNAAVFGLASPNSTTPAGSTRYRPPHARRRSSSSSGKQGLLHSCPKHCVTEQSRFDPCKQPACTAVWSSQQRSASQITISGSLANSAARVVLLPAQLPLMPVDHLHTSE